MGMFDDDNTFDEFEDFFSGGGGPKGISWKYSRPGESVTGVIFDMEIRDKISLDTKLPEVNAYGKVKKVLVLHLLTDQRDPEIEGDDGTRRAFLQGNALFEFKKFLSDNKIGKPVRGGRFYQKLTGTKKTEHPSPQNLFECKYGAPTAESLAAVDAHLAKTRGAQETTDPFATSTPAATPAAARPTTLNSMRSTTPVDDSPPF